MVDKRIATPVEVTLSSEGMVGPLSDFSAATKARFGELKGDRHHYSWAKLLPEGVQYRLGVISVYPDHLGPEGVIRLAEPGTVWQRGYDEQHALKLAGRIYRSRYIHPVILAEFCDGKGQRFYRVIDGQHRLSALRFLRTPWRVGVVIVSGFSETECVALYQTVQKSKNTTIHDGLKSLTSTSPTYRLLDSQSPIPLSLTRVAAAKRRQRMSWRDLVVVAYAARGKMTSLPTNEVEILRFWQDEGCAQTMQHLFEVLRGVLSLGLSSPLFLSNTVLLALLELRLHNGAKKFAELLPKLGTIGADELVRVHDSRPMIARTLVLGALNKSKRTQKLHFPDYVVSTGEWKLLKGGDDT